VPLDGAFSEICLKMSFFDKKKCLNGIKLSRFDKNVKTKLSRFDKNVKTVQQKVDYNSEKE